jgi:hypothetical protein
MPASIEPSPDEHLQTAIDLLTTAVLRRIGREHKLNHPLFSGEPPSGVAIGDQTSVAADASSTGREGDTA